MSRNLVPPEVFDTLRDALTLNAATVFLCSDPSKNTPNDFHVISSLHHEKFNDLRAKGCNLIGPQCVLSCAKENRPLPKQRGFTCCLAMDGLKLLASGFDIQEKENIVNMVTSMGGLMQTKISSDVNFVIWAVNVLKKPIVTINWLQQCWNEHRVVPQEPYKILPFSGLTICITRIRAGDKYKVARKWGHIKIVTRKWFDQSIIRRVCMNEESYPVQVGSVKIDLNKVMGNSQSAPSSVAADSMFSSFTDQNSETILSPNMSSKFREAPVLTKECDSERPTMDPTDETKTNEMVDDCVADDSESEGNDLYLSECRILLVGFEANDMRKLVNMVRRGGGSRYMLFNDKLTHIIVGTPSETEKKEVRSLVAVGMIHVVRTNWLEDCDRKKKELPVLPRHIAHDLLLPKDSLQSNKGATNHMVGINQGRNSTIHQNTPMDMPMENKKAETGNMSSLERERNKNQIYGDSNNSLARGNKGQQKVLQDSISQDPRSNKGATFNMVGVNQGKNSTIHQSFPMDLILDIERQEIQNYAKSFLVCSKGHEKRQQDSISQNLQSEKSSGDLLLEIELEETRFSQCHPNSSLVRSKSREKRQQDSISQNLQSEKLSTVFKGRRFRFSSSFPEDRRAEIHQWVTQGGGKMVDDYIQESVHFTIECHGVRARTSDVHKTTYVSTHWVRTCLEDGYLLDIGSHVLFSPLHCQIPLPGFEKFRFCVSQYEDKDRKLLRNLCFVLGAKFVEKLTKKVTHLLCKFKNGPKYEHACKWGIQSVTSTWIYECITQNNVVPVHPFCPKDITAGDLEAGLCTVSQFPTQAARMISDDNPSQLLGTLEDQKMASINNNIDVSRVEHFTDPKKKQLSFLNKRARLLPDDDHKLFTSFGERLSGAPQSSHSTEDNKLKDNEEVSQVPDVASTIEDLLEQTSKMVPQFFSFQFEMSENPCAPHLCGVGLACFISHGMENASQDKRDSPPVIGLSKQWLNRNSIKDDTSTPSGDVKKSTDYGFSETQTDSQIVMYEEDLSGRQMLIDRVTQYNDPSQSPWIGPVPGDIAEVEAYCRIFRAAERFHTALMDTLCNPLTGECSIPYDFSHDEKPLLEDKIVSCLGCIISLLNKGREDVLSGRSSIVSSFRVPDLSLSEEKLPPLAVFRGEMKRCCESLHVALENYLTPDEYRSLTVWRKLQRLKNVCYDSGFPRADEYPCHTLFANYGPVYLSTSKEENEGSEVAFWKGGHVTEEGLKWLLEKGFKTIVDIRAEVVKDNFYTAAINEAISSGKIEIVKIPVKVNTSPSMEQVEKFASLVSDCSKTPIYLHSKEGLRRTCAMVSRWKQFMSRYQPIFQNDISLQNTNEKSAVQESSTVKEMSLVEKTSFGNNGSNGALQKNVSPQNKERKEEINGKGRVIVDGITSAEIVDTRAGSPEKMETDPLKAQVPPCNVFSRREMTTFFRNRKTAPSSYFNYRKTWGALPVLQQKNKNQVVDTLPISENMEAETSNASVTSGVPTTNDQNGSSANDEHLNKNSNISDLQNMKGKKIEVETHPMPQPLVSINEKNSSLHYETPKSIKIDVNGNGSVSKVSVDLGSVEGNMCASATGVVRVQSRKKAEMFLVRTDGFSCTRERVTESSLAFTHPSTQQQMLMWKSTPKTVLLFKKLGQELLEEAKEVASFLYHQEKMNVLVEPDVHDVFARIPGYGFVQTFYTQDISDLHERVDFVACLGGDGVILHASNLFRGAVPPVVSFNLGSLGFLTSHTFEDFRQDLRQVIHGNNTLDGVYITLRMRLRCEIFRNGRAVPGKVFDILNEVVVDRGSNPYLSKIECYEHDRLITKVQGDGVIVATPTGSTAYSTAAGGSMVHPNVPCMLFTPICPHSLSFRPVILPDSARLELKIPDDARSNAWVSFDGKRRQQLSRGDSVRISMSEHPLPTVNKSDQTGDWFHSLIRCLNWNERLDQKAL
ncbi:hypothetical protein ACFE04_012366 [Oxalis oulophora]